MEERVILLERLPESKSWELELEKVRPPKKMPIELSLVQRTIVDDIVLNGIPKSQAS